MAPAYLGPLRGEPLAIELHNTLYANRGASLDGLADDRAAGAWLAALADRLPAAGAGRGPTRQQLAALRHVVQQALHAVVEGREPSRASLDDLNRASARAPRSSVARWRRDGHPLPDVQFHGASRADVVLSSLAADAIDLLTGPRRGDLRACGAPGCILLFLKDHPRRQWCSATCGNRARQARHYHRTHERDAAR